MPTAPIPRLGLTYEGCSGPLVFENGEGLISALNQCQNGWSWQPAALAAQNQPLATTVAAGDGRYFLASRYSDRPTSALSPAAAVCGLVADLSLDWAQTAGDTIGLHAAAIEVEGALIVFIGPARAGKTTFASRLCATPACRFFCDDVLAVDRQGHGIALGLAPRLRLPVPQQSPALSELLEENLLLADRHYAYFRPPHWAAHGVRTKIAGLVLLERREGISPELHALEEGAAMAAILRQVLTDFPDAQTALNEVARLFASLPRARLVYDDLEAGIATFLARKQAFLQNSAALPVLCTADIHDGAENTAPPVPPDMICQRAAEAHLRQIGSKAWACLPQEAILWELNPTAQAIWLMLEIPGSAEELAESLHELFPEISHATLTADVAALLGQMAEIGLIEGA